MARPRSDIEPRIVLSARRCFLEQGVDGTALRTIARGADTSVGMLYYYFPTKDDLFLAVVEETYIKLLSDMTEALAPGVPVDERLRRLYERIGAVSATEVETVQLVVREALVSTARFERLVERFLAGHIPLVLQTLADGMMDGSIDRRRPLSLLAMATLALGAVPQLVRRAAGDRLPLHDWPDNSVMAAALVDLLFHGIGARDAPAKHAADEQPRSKKASAEPKARPRTAARGTKPAKRAR